MIDMMGYERHAEAVRTYQPLVLPGMLQTRRTAEEISFYGFLTEAQRRLHTEARVKRRERPVEREDGPGLFVVLDQSVLLREVGEESVRLEQMELLEKVAGRSPVRLRIFPFARGGRIPQLGPFTIVDLDEDDTGDAVLYRETRTGDEIVEDPEVISEHRSDFEMVWHHALSDEASLRMIALEGEPPDVGCHAEVAAERFWARTDRA